MTDGNEEIELSTDEAILNAIGEGDESSTNESTGGEGTGEEKASDTKSEDASGGQNTDEGGNDQQENKQVAGPQDLVDGKGNIIAAGGKERRFYETAQREKQRAEGLNKEVETLKVQLQAINDAGNLGTQYSLSPEELTTGAQLIASYKENPVNTIKYMLTQAQANGYNIDDLGGNVDMGAIKSLVENALAPLVSEQQQRIDTQEIEVRANEVYNGFITKYPDASIHESSLARLLTEDPSLSPEAAYYKLQSYYSSRNLDWTKSLETLQNEAAKANAENTRANTQPQPPEGGGVSNNNVTDTANVADINVSFDDIIKEEMAKAGISS